MVLADELITMVLTMPRPGPASGEPPLWAGFAHSDNTVGGANDARLEWGAEHRSSTRGD